MAGAKAALQPWLAVEQAIAGFQGGRYASTAGALAGGLVLHHSGGKQVRLFGRHDNLPLGVLAALSRVEKGEGVVALQKWLVQHAQATFLADVRRFAALPAPSVSELLKVGVSFPSDRGGFG